MHSQDLIESAELKFQKILEEFFISIYKDQYLSSHGIDHHRRVWRNARELILSSTGIDINSQYAENLIIACYLHDIGMIIETGIKHGRQSCDMCKRFLSLNNLEENMYIEALKTIENHDDKEYITRGQPGELLTMLSIADDLDAFGFTGIFRYYEIYMMRGTDPKEAGGLIRTNAEKRFNHFIDFFASDVMLTAKHKKRYDILDSFFEEYNNQAVHYDFNGRSPEGYCGAMEVLGNFRQDNITSQACSFIIENEPDPIIRWFFSGLMSELRN